MQNTENQSQFCNLNVFGTKVTNQEQKNIRILKLKTVLG